MIVKYIIDNEEKVREVDFKQEYVRLFFWQAILQGRLKNLNVEDFKTYSELKKEKPCETIDLLINMSNK